MVVKLKRIGVIFPLALLSLSSCNTLTEDVAKASLTRRCSAYDTDNALTQYSARLIRIKDASHSPFDLHIQVFHPKTPAEQIRTIIFDTEIRPKFSFIGDDCVCGLEFNNADAGCGHVARYVVPMQRDWLEQARTDGMTMQFELRNGLTIDGPTLSSRDIDNVLS